MYTTKRNYLGASGYTLSPSPPAAQAQQKKREEKFMEAMERQAPRLAAYRFVGKP